MSDWRSPLFNIESLKISMLNHSLGKEKSNIYCKLKKYKRFFRQFLQDFQDF
jgi:hypothetical protein